LRILYTTSSTQILIAIYIKLMRQIALITTMDERQINKLQFRNIGIEMVFLVI